MTFEELELQISDIKNNLRLLIPQLIECKHYLENYENYIDASNKPLCNEQIAKDQLILPVLRELGYVTEYQNNDGKPTLNVWAETSLGADASKVDYAIFLEDTKFPRMIIEAKALAKIETKRGDYTTPSAQTKKYYEQYCERILVSVLTNGERWTVFKRKYDADRLHPTIDTNKPDIFALSSNNDDDKKINNLSTDVGLDKFVRMLCKPVLVYSLEHKTENDYKSYDNYRREIPKRMYLKKAVSTYLTPIKDYLLSKQEPIEKFFEFFDVEKIIDKANEFINEQCQPEYFSDDGSTFDLAVVDYKAAKKDICAKEDRRKNQISSYKGTIKAILNELLKPVKLENSGDFTSDRISSDPDDAPSFGSDSKESNCKDSDLKVGDAPQMQSTSEIITTVHELAVRDCIQKSVGDLCEVKYIDNVDYIDFVISNLSEKELKEKEGNKKAKDSKDCVFCLRYGKQDRKIEEHPQDGNYNNALLTFFAAVNTKESETHEGGASAGLTNKIKEAGKESTRGYNGWVSVRIQSLDDINDLKDAIKYWFGVRKAEFSEKF